MADVETCSRGMQGVSLDESRPSPTPQVHDVTLEKEKNSSVKVVSYIQLIGYYLLLFLLSTLEGDHDSGVDESTQAKEPTGRGSIGTIQKASSRTSVANSSKRSISPSSPSKMAQKLPMNKVQVGFAPSPNLKAVQSKINSLANATHKPGGGNVKIETRKIQIDAKPRIQAVNENYTRSGGDVKIATQKLQWNAKPKIGSLENAAYKPGGGNVKIETKKIQIEAKSKIGSLENTGYKPGGGDKKIETRKLEFNAKSKVGSINNIKHVPGGGKVKIISIHDELT
nr:EOG090X0G74 [Macrothrix elegans]